MRKSEDGGPLTIPVETPFLLQDMQIQCNWDDSQAHIKLMGKKMHMMRVCGSRLKDDHIHQSISKVLVDTLQDAACKQREDTINIDENDLQTSRKRIRRAPTLMPVALGQALDKAAHAPEALPIEDATKES